MKYLVPTSVAAVIVAGCVALIINNLRIQTPLVEEVVPLVVNDFWTTNACPRGIPDQVIPSSDGQVSTFVLDSIAGTGTEKVSLADGTQFTFTDSGCEYIEHLFTFQVPRDSTHPIDTDKAYWYQVAIDKMKSIVHVADFALDIQGGIEKLEEYKNKISDLYYNAPESYNDQGEENGGAMQHVVALKDPIVNNDTNVELSVEFTFGPL